MLWYGAIDDIPEGWTLCDGTLETPDLRDKFIIGAGDTYNPGDTGGTLTHSHGGTFANHAHLLSAIPNVAQGADVYGGTYPDTGVESGSISTDSKNHLPPYYALCYIMKA